MVPPHCSPRERRRWVGEEAWKAKEAKVPAAKEPLWGDQRERGIHWEVATAMALLEAGAEVLVLRHPEALARIRTQLDSWFGVASLIATPGGAPCR